MDQRMAKPNQQLTDSSTTNQPRPAGWWLYFLGIAILVGAVLLLARLVKTQKVRVLQEVQARTEAIKAGPSVRVVTVGSTPPERTITLLGEAHPFQTVTLYTKVSGYLHELRVDIGDKVEQDQVLAAIESPETDQQYLAAVADAKNKRLNAERAQTLVKRQMIAQQEADQAETDARVAEANVAALATLKSYEVLRAPFRGTVTARYADRGALLQNAASSQTSALPLLTVSETDRLRVYVYPDQSVAAFIRVGDRAEITLPERPAVKVAARVTRLSGELDPKTRTMLTEIDVNNRSGVLLPGNFVQVSLQLRAKGSGYIEIPAEALVLRGSKPFVAVLTPDNRVNYRPVTIADDDGKTVRIRTGLARGDRVALSLGDNLAEGDQVQPAGSH